MDHLEIVSEKKRLEAEEKAKAEANIPLIVKPPESLKRALTIPEKTLLEPGPSNVPERILSMTNIGHLHPEFCKLIMDDCKAGLQYAFQTKVGD